jgi:hypothetical protein
MPLPSIKISFLNGQLGTVSESQDGLLALVCGATQVASTFSLGKAYTIYRLAGLEALGVTAENNTALYRHVKDFYTEAEEGTRLVVYGVEKTKKMTDLCDKDSGPLKALLQAQKGELRGLIIARDPGEEVVSVTEGLDPDVFTAIPKAQALAEWATTDLYAPIFVALEGRSFDGDADSLQNLSEQANNRVCVVIGDTTAGSEGAAMGLLAARIASAAVQRNIGRVADGAIAATEMYLGDKPVEEVMDAISTIYDKGYITPRTYVGKSGYFWTDDKLATEPTDDYAHLTHRRVVDKAYRIAYDTLLNYMLDEIMVNTDGTMQQAVLKSWQAAVESAIDNQMTAQGELSADLTAGESGCSCYIDPSQNVLATSTVNITLKVRPYGYARYIVVELGFLVEAQS